MIYFLKARSGRIKIGTTVRLSQRLKNLAAEHGELEVLAVVDGGYTEERNLHGRFAHLRVVNEWFEPGGDLLGFIVAEGRPWRDSDDKADDDGPKPNALVIRGSAEWREWLGLFAVRCRSDMAGTIDAALAEMAERKKFRPPPPRKGQ